jgi:hypothetical protein
MPRPITNLICHETGAPNNAFEPTPLCGERDRADFEGWFRLDSFADLSMRRGSILTVSPLRVRL